ncbi:unnamed protein product, partial [Brassica rapa]
VDYKIHDENSSLYNTPPCVSGYTCVISFLTICWRKKSELEAEFIKEAAKEKMVQLKGHRSVGGGMRASIYNA